MSALLNEYPWKFLELVASPDRDGVYRLLGAECSRTFGANSSTGLRFAPRANNLASLSWLEEREIERCWLLVLRLSVARTADAEAALRKRSVSLWIRTFVASVPLTNAQLGSCLYIAALSGVWYAWVIPQLEITAQVFLKSCRDQLVHNCYYTKVLAILDGANVQLIKVKLSRCFATFHSLFPFVC